MPRGDIKSKQAVYTLSQLHAELADRASRHVGRLTKYNTLTGNTWGVSSPVFTRNHPPG